MNSVAYLPRSKCLLEQVSEVPRYQHFSLKTEQAYLYWIRFFVRWHGRDGQMQHPRSMGGAEVTAVNAQQTYSRDPKDDAFIHAALAAQVSRLITADKDLLCLHPLGDLQILSPRARLN